MVGWTVAIRTRIIDDIIMDAIAGGVAIVVNLGTGLDSRPYRMSLPASLVWIEADYPHVIDYKESRLATEQPRCRLERVKIDLADRAARQALLAGIDARGTSVLILTEGVVPYLTVEEGASLADDLRAMTQVRTWIVDYVSPQLMKWRRDNGMERRIENARFRFEPADWFDFFRGHGWRAREVHYMSDAADRLGRPLPVPWYARALMRLLRPITPRKRLQAMRQFAAYVLLEPC